ncbi:oligosaccharide flippase family protein [Nucisporomicrobium flavum]|uniref:oligosaccharide flippase family protein n=1 Tax=Nucisporomicrobium flavum TaxID=2785915 RepID=UPI003C2D3822
MRTVDDRQGRHLTGIGVSDRENDDNTFTRPGSARPSSRTAGRARKLLAWICTAALGRAVSAVVPLTLLPITLSYLGTELYGLWAAVIALTGMIVFADLGVGLGLMTKLAPCRAEGDDHAARRLISSAYAAVSTVSLSAGGVLWIASGVIPWSALFNAHGPTAESAHSVAMVCFTAFFLNIPLSLVVRVQYAYQQVVASNVWQAGGSALSLPLALIAIWAHAPAIVVIGLIAASPLIVNLANTAWTFGRRLKHLTPRVKFVDRGRMRDLFSIGGLFLVVTLVMVLADNADPLVIAHILGLGAVTSYAVPARLFGQIGAIVAMVNQPTWPMHGEAVARGDFQWVRRTVRRMTVVSVAVTICPSIIIVIFGEQLLSAWLPVPMGNRSLLLGFACWWVLLAAISPRFMVQNAAGVVRPQLWGYAIYFPLSILGKVGCVQWFGVSATPYAAVAAYCLTVLPAAIIGYRKVLAKTAVSQGEKDVALAQ